jgi:hypothetical protein
MGVSIYLKRIDSAEDINKVLNLEQKVADSQRPTLNIERAGQDLAIIFTNKPNFDSDIKHVAFRALYGNPVNVSAGGYSIGGFVPTSQVKEICDWLRSSKLTTEAGFEVFCDKLSKESHTELEDIGDEDKMSLYEYRVKPLVQFYLEAEKEHNSIVLYGL